jgi:hypothetical protein
MTKKANIRKRTYEYWDQLIKNRNIVMCYRWRVSFDDFVLDMGKIPTKKHFIHLRDGEFLYCKRNCMWMEPTVFKAIKTFCDPDYIPDGYHYHL